MSWTAQVAGCLLVLSQTLRASDTRRPFSTPTLPTLTTAQQIRTLSPDEARRGNPVHLRAVVTYFDSRASDFFVEDATAGIDVNDPTPSLALKPGDLLDIVGVTEQLDFAPQVGSPHYRVIGKAPLPKAVPSSFDALMSNREDSQWIQFEGIVQSAASEKGNLSLEIVGGGGHLAAHILNAGERDPASPVNARVRIEGVCAAILNHKGQFIGVQLQVPGPGHLRTLETPGPDPFTLPARALSDVTAFATQGASGHWIHVQGTVTLQRPRSLFIQEGAQGLFIAGPLTESFKPGDRVDAVGFADIGDYTPVLQHAIVRRTGSAPLPAPFVTKADQTLTGSLDTVRVRLDATLRDQRDSEPDRELVLQDGDVLFEARIERKRVGQGWSALAPGSRLRLAGVCSVSLDRNRVPSTFTVLLDSPRDVLVLSRPPWWGLRNALIPVATLAVVALAALGWALVLARKVRMVRQGGQFFSAIPHPAYVFDLKTLEFLEVNDTAIRHYGYSREDFLRMKVTEIRLPEDLETFRQEIRKLKSEKHASGEQRHLTKSRRVIDSEVSSQSMIFEGYEAVLAIAQDVTEQKRAEEALHDTRERFRRAFEDAPFGMCLTTLDGHFLQVNRALCKMLRYSSDELVGGTWSAITHPDDNGISSESAAQLESGKLRTAELEKRYVRADGRVVWVKLKITAVNDRQGYPSYYIAHIENITEQRIAEQALRESEERYRSLVINIPDVVWTADATGGITFVSPNLEKIFGYTVGEAYKKGLALFMERLHPDDTGKVADAIQAVMTTGERREMECRLQRKDGEWIWVHNRAIGSYERGGVRYVVGLISDISERKRAEAENNRLAAALSQAGEGVVITDSSGTIQYVNPAFSRITGYSAAEAIGRNPRLLKSGRQDPAYYAELWQTIRSGHAWEGELVNRRRDGTFYTEEMTIAPVRDASGAINSFVAVKRDISDRKMASEALHQSRQLLQSVLDNIPQRVFWKDRNSNFLGCNRAFAADAGLNDPSEIVGEDDFAFPWKEAADAFRADDRLVINTESPRFNQEERRDSATAKGRWVRANKVPLRDERGSVMGVLGTYEDITEQRQAEQTRALLASIVESSNDAIMGTTLDGTILSWNRGAELLYGYSAEEVIGKRVSVLVPPDLQHEITQILDRIKEGKATSHFETRRIRRDGGSVDILLNVSPLRDAFGEVIGASAIAHDIGERKQAEEALRKSDEHFRQLAENIREVFFVITPEPVQVTYVSPAYEEIWGRSRQGVYSRPEAWTESIHPEDRDRAVDTFVESQRGTATDVEYRIMRPDGSVRWIRNRTFPLRDGEDRFYRVVGTAEDITERKQAEEALVFKNALLEAQSEATLDGILAVDEAMRVVLYNRQFALLWRVPDAILAARDDARLLEQVTKQLEDPDGFLAKVKYLYDHPNERSQDELRLNDGRTLDRYSAPLVDSNCRQRGRIWYFRDITERKQSEEALRTSEQRVRLLLDSTAEAIYGLDLTDKCTFVNPACLRILGYDNQETVLGRNMHDLLHHSRADGTLFPAAECPILRTLETGESVHADGDVMWRADGTSFPAEYWSHPIHRDGQVVGAVVGFLDITERKLVERDLEQERTLFRALMDAIPDTIYFQDTECRFTRINKAQAKLLGVTDPREAVGKTDFDFFPAEIAQTFYENEKKLLQTGEPIVDLTEEIRWSDGRVQWLSATEVPLRDAQGEITGYVGVSRDITDRKLAEEKLRRTEESYRSLVSHIPDVTWTMDAHGHLTFMSPNFERISGYSLSDLTQNGIGLFYRAMHPDDVERVRRALNALFRKGQAYDVECRVRRRDGEWMWIHDRALTTYERDGIQYADGLLSDITERKQLQIELQQAQRLEAVGQLAAGIAHEINTPIQFVGDNTRFLRQSFQDVQKLLRAYEKLAEAAAGNVEERILQAVKEAQLETDWEYLELEIPKALEQTLDGVNRVAKIVRAMKEFSHVDQSGQRSAADLNKALDSTLIVARNELKYVADVLTEFGNIPSVVCDLGELNQVFLNLLINAAHAIGDVVKGTDKKGTIRVKTWQEDGHVVVAVGDTGTGIPEAIQERIFDPFFTTKPVGKGTGQGLTLARSVVNRHSGSLTFETGLGKGTTFFVRLPITSPQTLDQETQQYESYSVCR